MGSKFEIYNSELHTRLILKEVSKGIFTIKKGDFFLSIPSEDNIVDFYVKDDGSNRQRWSLETDENNFTYIKNLYKRKDKLSYLGSPNLDRNVYLYSSKNRFTRWKLQQINSDTNEYLFQYVGETFNPEDITVIVSRYKENVEWTKPYSDICLIYNKGPVLIGYKRYKELPNLGREGHTYLYHIVECYDTLARWNIFLQGDPFPHNDTILFGIDNYEKIKPIQSLSIQYLEKCDIPTRKAILDNKIITDYGFEYAEYKVNNNMDNRPHFIDKGIDELVKRVRSEYTDMLAQKVSIFERFLRESRFPLPFSVGKFPETITMCYSALFGVKKERILAHPKEIYSRLLKEIIRKNSQGGTNVYVIERLWLYIFGRESDE